MTLLFASAGWSQATPPAPVADPAPQAEAVQAAEGAPDEELVPAPGDAPPLPDPADPSVAPGRATETISPPSADVAGALFGTSMGLAVVGYLAAHLLAIGGFVGAALSFYPFGGGCVPLACGLPFAGMCGAAGVGVVMPGVQGYLIDLVGDQMLADDAPTWPTMLASYGACIPLSLVGLFLSGTAFFFSTGVFSAFAISGTPPPFIPSDTWTQMMPNLMVYFLTISAFGHAVMATIVAAMASAVPVAVRAYNALETAPLPDAAPPPRRVQAALRY